MSTTLANPVEMIRLGAPHLIHCEGELAEYTAALFELTGKPAPTEEEEEAIELLTLLIDRYGSQHYSIILCQKQNLLKCCGSSSIRMISRSAT